jgi:hypothetical protein
MNTGAVAPLGVRLRRMFFAAVLALVAAVALAFVIDFLIFRIRVAANWNPYGSVNVDHYYAVAEKSGKTEFMFDPPQAQTCSHSLFPQSGYQPCWYLNRHPEQRTNV